MVNTRSAPPPRLTETVESTSIRKMAAISSMISVPMARDANFFSRILQSSMAFTVMMVEDMESIPPRKRLSVADQPMSIPAR